MGPVGLSVVELKRVCLSSLQHGFDFSSGKHSLVVNIIGCCEFDLTEHSKITGILLFVCKLSSRELGSVVPTYPKLLPNNMSAKRKYHGYFTYGRPFLTYFSVE